jgi:hypothetical protein
VLALRLCNALMHYPSMLLWGFAASYVAKSGAWCFEPWTSNPNLCLQGWGDVYYFCGRHMQYCTCNLSWNLLGWVKACILWNFVLSSGLGAQFLCIHLGLNGLLPGAAHPLTIMHHVLMRSPVLFMLEC